MKNFEYKGKEYRVVCPECGCDRTRAAVINHWKVPHEVSCICGSILPVKNWLVEVTPTPSEAVEPKPGDMVWYRNGTEGEAFWSQRPGEILKIVDGLFAMLSPGKKSLSWSNEITFIDPHEEEKPEHDYLAEYEDLKDIEVFYNTSLEELFQMFKAVMKKEARG